MKRVPSRRAIAGVAAVLLLHAAQALAYDARTHQRLTFYAAKEFNRCLAGTDAPTLTPLQVRFIATSNMGLAEASALSRMLRWSYFDPSASLANPLAPDAGQIPDRSFLWLVNTRFLNHYQELVEHLHTPQSVAESYQQLGTIVGYVQMVTAPARALPVFAPRFWRWSFGDRMEQYPLDETALESALGSDCRYLQEAPISFEALLEQVADETLRAVLSPIPGLPGTWQAFWRPGDTEGAFGSYGPAGNSFGQRVEFPCGDDGEQRCMLVDDDPLYAEFALARHLAAVHATARAMLLHQTGPTFVRELGAREPGAREPEIHEPERNDAG